MATLNYKTSFKVNFIFSRPIRILDYRCVYVCVHVYNIYIAIIQLQ